MSSDLTREQEDRIQRAWNNLRDAKLRAALRPALSRAVRRAQRSLVRKGKYSGSSTATFLVKDADLARFGYGRPGHSFEDHATAMAQALLTEMGIGEDVGVKADSSHMTGFVYVFVHKLRPAS